MVAEKVKNEIISDEKQLEEYKQLLKEYLSQLYVQKNRKVQLTRRLKEVNAELKSPFRGMNYSPIPRSQTNKVGAGAASILYRIAEIEERIIKQTDNIGIAMLKVMDIMDFLPEQSTERMILELRHIDCKPWKQIMIDVSLTRTPCYEYYNRGLEKLLSFKKVIKVLDEYRNSLD